MEDNKPIETPTQGEPPVTQIELADGTNTGIAQDTSAQVDAIDPYGQFTIDFKTGNWTVLQSYPDKMKSKLELLSHTIVPLIEKAMIELLGSSGAYNRKAFNGALTINADSIVLEADIIYNTTLWIGQDITTEAIANDANYVLNTLKVVPGVQWRKCEISTATGDLTIAATC